MFPRRTRFIAELDEIKRKQRVAGSDESEAMLAYLAESERVERERLEREKREEPIECQS